jgi:hypothetical protein
MSMRGRYWTLVAGPAVAMICLYTAALAADCGMPVAAPKYEVGEQWTWKNDKGREWVNRVMEVKDETAAIQWPGNNVAYYSKDWVVEKVKKSSGEMVEKQGAGTFTEVGQKILDFPLDLQKTWRWSATAVPSGGRAGLVIYTHHVMLLACEEVQTPAGTYPALKLEVTQRATDTGRSGTYYLWWAPAVKQLVKRQYVPSRWWGSSVTDYELIKYEKEK